jgi:CelD/BcsL family acetyltransferase involved in cellulose biosynthesis
MLQVSEINELHELASLRATWRELLVRTPGYSFFRTLEWLETAWPQYPLRQKLRVMLVERGGRPVGIVPFCVRSERRKVGTVRILTYPLNDWGTFYGPLGMEPGVAIRAAIEQVAKTPRDWDFIDLCWVDQAAPEFMSIGEALRGCGYDFIVRPRMEVRLVEMAEGWEAYVKSRSRNWRQKMRRDTEALEKRGGKVNLVRYRPAAGEGRDCEHDEVYDICASIAERSWQSAAESQSTLSSPRVRELLRQLHRQAGRLGMLDTNLLTVGGRPVAFNYNYLAENRAYGLRSGFDQTAGLENCGKILIYKMLEDAFARGDAEYSFGPGRQPYKDRFATEMRYAYTFRHYARYGVRPQLLHLRERMASRLWSEAAIVEKSLVT